MVKMSRSERVQVNNAAGVKRRRLAFTMATWKRRVGGDGAWHQRLSRVALCRVQTVSPVRMFLPYLPDSLRCRL
jgi:hypothetical protein